MLAFLYGADNLEKMLLPDNIIEHLDNNVLNCSYDNLHILSSDRNKGKAFLIDKEVDKFHGIPLFITDVFYSHNRRYYQMQIGTPFKELQQVLPGLDRNQIRVLMRELRESGKVFCEGTTSAARWFASK